MAVLQRVALQPNERWDTPDARAIEGFVLNDFRFFISGFFSQSSYILAGFEITNYSTIFTVPGFMLTQNDVVLFYPQASTQAAGFYVFAGTEQSAAVSLSPSATNYVEATLSDISGTPDVRAFWDESANGGAGAEFTDTIDTVINLNLQVLSNISGFTPGNMPLYKVVTNSSGIVTSVTDCRNLFFRLGTGGNSPNPNNTFSYPNLPDSAHSRFETPITATSATASNAPFQGGDKNINTFKEWMDVVMSSLKEIKGTAYWYMPPLLGSSTPGAYQNAALTLFTGGTWEHLLASTGHLVLLNGSNIVRLGNVNTVTLSSFTNIDLTTNFALYILLPLTDIAVTCGFGQDAATPIIPKTVTSVMTSTITANLGGNYITGGGKIMVHGSIFSYTSYTSGTGLFSGVTPDPSGLVSAGDYVYQSDNGSSAYYHTSVSSAVPNVEGTVSFGAERVMWLAYFDGSETIELRNADLIPGEQINVGDATSLNLLDLIGGTITPITDATTDPMWVTRGAPLRTITSTNSILDAIASEDNQIDKFFGQIRLTPGGSADTANLSGADVTMLDGVIRSQTISQLFMNFIGAKIDFTTGVILDSLNNPLGINFTPFAIPSGQYFWYGVGLSANTTGSDNRETVQVLITPASAANASPSAAPYPDLSATVNIGAVLVHNNAGSIQITTIRQLGSGSGGGGGGSASLTKVVNVARGFPDGTLAQNATVTTVASKTRVVVTGFSWSPNVNAGLVQGDPLVLINGQVAERLVTGINDTEGDVVWQEVGSSGTTINLWHIVSGSPTPLQPDTLVEIIVVQYTVTGVMGGGVPIEYHGNFAFPIAIDPTVGIPATGANDQVWWVTPTTVGPGLIPISNNPQIAPGSVVGQRLTVFGVTSGSGAYLGIINGNGTYQNGDFSMISGQCIVWMWNASVWQFVSNAI